MRAGPSRLGAVSTPTAAGRSRLARLLHHPRTGMALKAGVAATVAWLVALALPHPLDEYAYYAPLGAVVAIYPTVAGTVRESLQAVGAILLGAALALAADRWLGATPLVVAAVVTVGVAVGGLRVLGAQRSYVPVAAMFVLVIGQGQEVAYSASFALDFLLGAAVAVVVNLLAPQLLLSRADDVLGELRAALTARLHALADALTADDDAPAPARTGLTELTTRAREVVLEAREGERGNVRSRRHARPARARYDAFRALERVVLLVDDVHDLVADRPWGADARRAPTSLRTAIAASLRDLAVAVDDVGVRDADPEQRARALRAVDDLVGALRTQEAGAAPAEALVATTLATSLRRCLAVITPHDLLGDLPATGDPA